MRDADELAKLVYDSYKAGRISHLEVERANLKALKARIESVFNETELLIENAKLASLSKEEI